MNHMALEDKLSDELNALVRDNSDIFNPVLGISAAANDFHWTGAAGTAYADQPASMSVDTPIFIASITKMYTAAATMILEEQKRLSLKDPLSKYLPDEMVSGLHRFKGVDYSNQLTIYHLISQTSGLPDYFLGKPRAGMSIFERLIAEGDFGWDLEQVLEISKHSLSAKFPPQPEPEIGHGKRAFYSDTNYQLLGAILEKVTGMGLQEVYSELIFDPLELNSTYLHGYGDTTGSRNNPATIYYKEAPFYLDQAMTSFGPDGGVVSTVDDSLKFLHDLMKGALFSDKNTLERMKNWRRIFFPMQYGMGLMRIKMPKLLSPFTANPELIGHSGATSSFLFQSDLGRISITGTLNQVDNQARPVRLMFKIINYVNKTLS